MKEAKQLLELRRALQLDCCYNEPNKKVFETKSKAFLRLLGKNLGLKEIKVSYNKSGIACPGDPLLMGMWENGTGIYVKITEPMCGYNCMFRTISHMKDYTGGRNQWLDLNTSLMEEIIEAMLIGCNQK